MADTLATDLTTTLPYTETPISPLTEEVAAVAAVTAVAAVILVAQKAMQVPITTKVSYCKCLTLKCLLVNIPNCIKHRIANYSNRSLCCYNRYNYMYA